jgi:hypothetical protein
MKKEVGWISSRCISSVLAELAKKPLTPTQLRIRTGLTKNNYVNIILKSLESEKIIECLNPDDRIGRVFSISPIYTKTVVSMLRKKGINQKIKPLPQINWSAYGRLQCSYCTQLRKVFGKANQLRLEGRMITPRTIMEKLPAMATSDIYRALNKLAQLNLLVKPNETPKRFILSSIGLEIIELEPDILI